MKLPKVDDDRHLSILCQEIANICMSLEFKKLHKQMSKLYRKNGLRDAARIAFRDSLFSLYLEQMDLENSEEIPLR